MDFIGEFINAYGTTILHTAIAAIAGYLGLVKKEVARECVKFVEQVYTSLHGEDKLNKAIEAASQMLAEKGISITDLEMKVLIEAALAEFNDAFNKE